MNTWINPALALLFAACAPDAPPQDTTLVVSSDPELRSVVAEMLPGLAERSGLELHRPVRVERRSRQQLVAYLGDKLDEELPPEEAARTTASYALLGLVPEDLDLRAILLDLYTEQVAGFYDPDSTALFVMDDQPVEQLRTVLIHELVHAVQDQATDLDSITAPERGNDRRTAAQAAIEGHATLVMFEYLMEQMQGSPVDLAALPDFGGRMRPLLEATRSQYPALASAPAVIQESLLFPYLEGAGFVQAFWKGRGGRPAPFGADLPESTEQILDPERFSGPGRDEPTDVRIEASGGVATVYTDVLGELELRILLERHLGAAARERATGWDGDRFALFEAGGGERALVWAAVWDEAGARDAFVEALGAAPRSFPLPARLEARDVDGRPVSLLRIGSPPEVDIALGGGTP